MKSALKKYLGWFVSAIFLYFVFSGIHWKEFFEALSRISILELVLLVLLYVWAYPVRALRSRVLLPQLKFSDALGGIFVGYAANNVLPARLGEIVRAQVVGTGSGIRKSTLFSSIMIERILDGFAIVILLFIGSHGLVLPDWAKQGSLFGLILFSCALAGVLIAGMTSGFWRKLIPGGKLGHFLNGLLDGVCIATRDLKTILHTIVLSFMTWTMEGMMFLYAGHVFNFELSFLQGLFVLGMVNLGVLIPSSPGNLGVFQYFAVKSLAICGISEVYGAAYAVVVHLCQYLPVTIIGLLYLPHFGVKSFFDFKPAANDDDVKSRQS